MPDKHSGYDQTTHEFSDRARDYFWEAVIARLQLDFADSNIDFFFFPSTIMAKYEQKCASLSIIWGIWNESIIH